MNQYSLRSVLQRIEVKFRSSLQAKAGWGRKEVMELYQTAVNEVLLDEIEEHHQGEVNRDGNAA